ncbi:MAG: hypothetical protein KKH72_09910, partial [Alphaproteobacteria bacterium]|nr:hypothetical protein [Alphaproteobacteria bacterium]
AAEAQRVFEGAARATLELDEKAAEVLVGAASAGSLTLTLRATSGFGQAGTEGRSGADQAIRLTSRFWTDNYSPAL